MSLDYPLYEEMRRRGSRAARFWLAGDRLYYLGLLGGIVAVLLGVAGVWNRSLLGRVGYAGLGAGVGAGVFLIGAQLKAHSYRLAKQDGIDPMSF